MRAGLTLIGVGLILIGIAFLLPTLFLLQSGALAGAGLLAPSLGGLSGLGTIIIGIGVIVIGQNTHSP